MPSDAERLPADFSPFALVTAPDGAHWAAAGTFEEEEREAVVVDGAEGGRYAGVGRPLFTRSAGVVYTAENDDENWVVTPRGTYGPYSDAVTALQVSGDAVAFVHRRTLKGKTHLSVFVDGVEVATAREMGTPIPTPDGSFWIQAELTGKKQASGLAHKQVVLRGTDVVASGPGLQAAVVGKTGLHYLETSAKGFRLCREGVVLAEHEWMVAPAVRADSDVVGWAGRDAGRWKVYVDGLAHGDYDDVKVIDLARDGSFAAAVTKGGAWYAVTAKAEYGPLGRVSTVSAGPDGRVAWVAHSETGLVVGVDGASEVVVSAGAVRFCDDGALAYPIARKENVWTLVHPTGELGPFERLSNPVRVGALFVAHGLRDGRVSRLEVSAR